jgi:hypothetical protein
LSPGFAVYLMLLGWAKGRLTYEPLHRFQDIPSCITMREQKAQEPGVRVCMIIKEMDE